jgi:hypothetical protein
MTLQQILLMVDSMDVVAMSPQRRHDGRHARRVVAVLLTSC